MDNHIEELIMKVGNYAWSEMTLLQQGELKEAAAEELSALQKRVEAQDEFILSVREAMELHESHHKFHIERALAELDAK
jgi:CHASE1-domain containing sensor protein